MLNRIREIYIVNRRLDPNETVLSLAVELENISPTTELRGRLMGPRCANLSTVEVAYPLREVERSDSVFLMEAVIPEPSWWEPKSPFLYEGPLELWQDGRLCERIKVSHAIRWMQLTSKGLRLNGRPFLMRGKVVTPTCTDKDLQQLHEMGFNVAMTTAAGIAADVRSAGDRNGLFVSYGWNDSFITPGSIVLGLDILEDSKLQNRTALQSNQSPHTPAFMICRVQDVSAIPDDTLPKIVVTQSLPETVPSIPNLIGYIETAS